MTTGPGERGDRLAQLIQSRKDAGESLRDITRRAALAGHNVSHTYIDSLRQGMVPTVPSRAKVAALAAGLQVSEERLTRMVVQDWYGWDPGERTQDPEDLADLFDAMRAKFARYPQGEERRGLRNAHYRIVAEWEP